MMYLKRKREWRDNYGNFIKKGSGGTIMEIP
jgi:hypothetical protein